MNKETIKQIIVENHEFIGRLELTARDLSIEAAGNYVFTGSRRAGKTYFMFQIIQQLLKDGHIIEGVLYLNFEDERLLELKADELGLIIDAYKELFSGNPILFLDEIQVVEGWEKFARRLADTGYRLYITGSNAQMLSREIATTLGGRFIIQEVFPFSFDEYLRANGILLQPNWEFGAQRFEVRRLFDTYFYYGGFPEILRFKEKRMWLNNLYQKIFYGDLISRYKIRNDFALKLMVKKLAESVQDEVSFNRITNIIKSTGVKLSVATVIEYVSYLEESWLMFGVKNYYAKISERESQKKYYFIDNGILSLFLTSPETILLENIVACRLKRIYGEIYYLRANEEVDFYIPETKTLIQVAFKINSIETENREVQALLKAKPIVQAEKLLVITLEEQKSVIFSGHSVEFVPVWKWLLDLPHQVCS